MKIVYNKENYNFSDDEIKECYYLIKSIIDAPKGSLRKKISDVEKIYINKILNYFDIKQVYGNCGSCQNEAILNLYNKISVVYNVMTVIVDENVEIINNELPKKKKKKKNEEETT